MFYSVQKEPGVTANACGPKNVDFLGVFCLEGAPSAPALHFADSCVQNETLRRWNSAERENQCLELHVIEVRCSELCSVPRSQAEQRVPGLMVVGWFGGPAKIHQESSNSASQVTHWLLEVPP